MRGCTASGHMWSGDRRRAGFTLVELLVVVGLIALLMGLLFPALNKSRRAAVVTTCMGKIRDLDLAILEYKNQNNGLLPMATISNSIDSPFSPRGLAIWKSAPVYVVGQPITIDDTPYTPLHEDWSSYGHCAAPISWCLRQQTVHDLKIWQCPAQSGYTGNDSYRSGEYVIKPSVAANLEQILIGHDDTDDFRPGYLYMGTWENAYFIKTQPALVARYRLDEFYRRNIAGMLAARMRTLDGFGDDRIVVFTDYSPMYHTHSRDIYDARPGESGDYMANFAFLDGHVESRHFKDFDSYLAQFHGPINSGHQAGGY